MTPRKSQQHLNHRSRYRHRSGRYTMKKATKALTRNFFASSPFFTRLTNEYYSTPWNSGGTRLLDVLIYPEEVKA